MTSESCSPTSSLIFHPIKSEATACLQAQSEFCAVVGKRVSGLPLYAEHHAWSWRGERELAGLVLRELHRLARGHLGSRMNGKRGGCCDGDMAEGRINLSSTLTLRTQQV